MILSTIWLSRTPFLTLHVKVDYGRFIILKLCDFLVATQKVGCTGKKITDTSFRLQ